MLNRGIQTKITLSLIWNCIKAWLFHPSLIFLTIWYKELPIWTEEEFEIGEKVSVVRGLVEKKDKHDLPLTLEMKTCNYFQDKGIVSFIIVHQLLPSNWILWYIFKTYEFKLLRRRLWRFILLKCGLSSITIQGGK